MIADLPVLWRMLRGMPSGTDHQTRLDGFYRSQASGYDRFRERLLQGRGELMADLDLPQGGTLVELGAGTGRNLEFLGSRLGELYRAHLVDLCPSLVERARQRVLDRRWDNVEVHQADACVWRPPRPADAVVCAYSLTMMPDWHAVIDHAVSMLAPGGTLAVVDFYVSAAHPAAGLRRHGPLVRHGWPLWFAHDGVNLSRDHLPYLRRRIPAVSIHEEWATVPWTPGFRVPYYRFIGRKGSRINN